MTSTKNAYKVVDDTGSVVALPVTEAVRRAGAEGAWVKTVIVEDEHGGDVLDLAGPANEADHLRCRIVEV